MRPLEFVIADEWDNQMMFGLAGIDAFSAIITRDHRNRKEEGKPAFSRHHRSRNLTTDDLITYSPNPGGIVWSKEGTDPELGVVGTNGLFCISLIADRRSGITADEMIAQFLKELS